MEFAAWKQSLYGEPAVGTEDIQHVLHELDGTAWTTGIESDKKRRGVAMKQAQAILGALGVGLLTVTAVTTAMWMLHQLVLG